jgi:ribosome recycling factor
MPGDEDKTIDDVLIDGEIRMEKSLEALGRDLNTLRTGRATPALLENVTVDYYNTPTPLNQIASVSAPEARLIVIQPWDKGSIKDIEKSLQKSEMGFNPNNDGTVIRLPIPPLTQERRRDLVKVLKRKIEDGKIAVRNVRRDTIEQLRGMEKNKQISQDENRRAQDQIQKVTDSFVGKMDQVSSDKESEIMQV